MRLLMIGCALVASFSTVSRGQPSQSFDVAVIKRAQFSTNSGLQLFDGGRLRIMNETTLLLIRLAFQLQDAQIAGAPSWVSADLYDVEAQTGQPGRIATDQMGPLMQSLLAERFGLKFHWETRDITVYALVIAPGGTTLTPKTDADVFGMNASRRGAGYRLSATATSMDVLAGYLGNRLRQIVIDRTGLGGRYNFTLEWTPDDTQATSIPGLPTALLEQLGLRLQSQKAPVRVLVIDRIERPSDN
jgi:uncharacterized protein (TIGR03435 family)